MATTETIDPTTGEVLATWEHHGDQQVQETVEAAHEAFLTWRETNIAQRAELVRAIAGRLEARADELADLMSREMGKTPRQAHQEIALCRAICRWEAEHGPPELADEERDLAGGRALVSYQPLGVIFGIQPWNFPLYQVVRYSIPNLVAGNTVLLKHAANVWGSAQLIEEIYAEAGLPPDAFRHLRIDHDQAADVIAHPRVRGVTLTGSDRAGRQVAGEAAKHLKKTVLELGSNDAYVVLADADVDLAVGTCVQGRIYNNGETCVAAKRFIVEDAVYDRFRDAFVEQMRGIAMGDPRAEGTTLGPIAREDLRDTLHQQVTESVDRGARLTLGGELPDGPGFWYPATVLEDVAPGQPAYDDELFGPVAALIRASDAEDAMRIANDSRYGLGGGIFSGDEGRAVALARTHFDTGMVNVNGYHLAQPHLPFGGVKDSGYGREHGGFGIREFVNVKSVMVTQP